MALAKIAPGFARFHRCKITHFSQISQAFCSFSSFAKNKQHPILSKFTQIAHYETFTGIPFFANDFAPFGFVSISQRTTKGQLNHCNFHWLFLLNRRNVLYAGIAFRAERIEIVSLVFALRQHPTNSLRCAFPWAIAITVAHENAVIARGEEPLLERRQRA